MVTPVNVARYNNLLEPSKYPEEERTFLVNGFKNGFELGYQGKMDAKLTVHLI